MSTLSEFFLSGETAVVKYQLLEITHPNFSTGYKVTGTAIRTISVTHEDSTGPHVYSYFPMDIKTMGSAGSMDQELEVTLADLGTVLPKEIENIDTANGRQTKPVVIYREYMSNDLTTPMYGPFTLQLDQVAFNKQGVVFTAKPVAFNKTRTGRPYDAGRFPMLRGFVT